MNREDLFEGQTVKVYQSFLTSAQQGEIVRIGRTLVDIRIGAYSIVKQYRILDQRLSGRDNGSGNFFQTLEQYDAQKRRSAAMDVLARYGCRFDLGSRSVDVEKLEAIGRILEEQ